MWAYYLTHPIAASAIFGLTAVLLSFIDAKVNGVDRTRNDYIKLFVLVVAGTLGVLYLTGKRDSFKQLGGGNKSSGHYHHSSGHHHTGHRTSYEPMSADVPDF